MVLFWREYFPDEEEDRPEANWAFLDEFYQTYNVTDIPMNYGFCIWIDDNRPYKPTPPKKLQERRLKRIKKRVMDKYPLFYEEELEKELKRCAGRLDIDSIIEHQKTVADLHNNHKGHLRLPEKMTGNDGWQNKDWKAINQRSLSLFLARNRRLQREGKAQRVVMKK